MVETDHFQNWLQRSDQQNFEQNHRWLAQHVFSVERVINRQPVLFSHIPKNAGTTLEYILAKNHRLSDVLHVNAPDLNQQPNLLNLKKNPPQLICGHHPMHGLLYQLLPNEPLVHITMLRDPVDRVISYYNYISGNAQHPFHKDVIAMTFDDFIDHQQFTEISNGQAKRLSGYLHSDAAYDEEVLFETAKTVLQQCFTVVLITEKFDMSLLLLQSMLNLQDIYYLPHNQSRKLVKAGELNQQQQQHIEKCNAVDRRLHQYFHKAFNQLCQDRLSDDALDLFQQRQQQWRLLQNT